MARLTWQNVTGPDFGDALQATSAAAQSFRTGLDGLSAVAGGLDARRRNEINMAAMDRLLAQRDLGAWDQKMQQGGGLAALGVSASDASADLINAISGHRNRLTGERKTDYDFSRDMVEDQQQDVIHAEGRIDWRDEKDERDYTRGRSRRDDARADEAYDINKAMTTLIDEQARQTVSPQELQLQIANDPNLSPDERRAAMAAIAQAPTAHWAVDPNFSLSGTETGSNIAVSRKVLDEQEANQKHSRLQNRGLMALDASQEISGKYGNNPVLAVIEKMGLTNKVDKDGNALSEHDYAPGEAVDAFNRLKGEFKNVPPELIAVAMQDAVGSSGWTPLGNDDLSFLLPEARKILAQFNDPTSLQALQAEHRADRERSAVFQTQRASLDRAESELSVLLSKGNPPKDKVERLEKRIRDIKDGLLGMPGIRPIRDSDPLGMRSSPATAPASAEAPSIGVDPFNLTPENLRELEKQGFSFR